MIWRFPQWEILLCRFSEAPIGILYSKSYGESFTSASLNVFLPCTGIYLIIFPKENTHLSPFYDPLLLSWIIKYRTNLMSTNIKHFWNETTHTSLIYNHRFLINSRKSLADWAFDCLMFKENKITFNLDYFLVISDGSKAKSGKS